MPLETNWTIHSKVECNRNRDKGTKKRFLKKVDQIKSTKKTMGSLLRDWVIHLIKYLHGTYKHDGEFPKTVMSEEPPNIYQFCKFKWFEWVTFNNKRALYLDGNIKLGRYMWPSIDVGPAKVGQILTRNSQVLQSFTYWALTTQNEWGSNESREEQTIFMEAAHQRFCPQPLVENFAYWVIEDTPQCEQRCPAHRRDTPQFGWRIRGNSWIEDQCVNLEIKFPQGVKMGRGQVISLNYDVNGNSIGGSNHNTILNTHPYEMEFLEGEITELKPDIIADLMYCRKIQP